MENNSAVLNDLEYYMEDEYVDETQEYEGSNNEKHKRSQNWLDAPTKLLLSLIDELRPKVGKSMDLKNKSKMWQVISRRMAEENYNFTALQVQWKYSSLVKRYKQTKLNNSQTGRSRKTCPYQCELDQILSERRGINPDFVLDNECVDGISRSDADIPSGSSGKGLNDGNCYDCGTEATLSLGEDSTCSNDSPIAKTHKKKDTHKDEILACVKEMTAERKHFHSRILEYFDKKDKREEAKHMREEAKNKREEAKHIREEEKNKRQEAQARRKEEIAQILIARK